MTRIAVATLKNMKGSPYSQSRAHETEKLNRETPDQYEQRTWREKCHVTEDGFIFIPPMCFKASLDGAVQMLALQIPGRGKTTYTKFFQSGVLCIDPIVLPDRKDVVPFDRIHCNANGKPGPGTRVWRYFPRIDTWKAEVPFHVIADEISEDIFEKGLVQAGSFRGIGRFRPENRGYYGRFTVEKIKWQKG